MVGLGVHIAIIRDGRVVLTKREDFEVWCLPGGGVDSGESVAQAAIREAREETGLEVRLTRLVGIYSKPQWSDHDLLFAAEPVGGELISTSAEVVDIGYFTPSAWPEPLIPWHRQRLQDALRAEHSALACSQDVPVILPPELSRRELYALRDRSGLSRQEFFLRLMGALGTIHCAVEVGSDDHS